jgi:hypothetical protein
MALIDDIRKAQKVDGLSDAEYKEFLACFAGYLDHEEKPFVDASDFASPTGHKTLTKRADQVAEEDLNSPDDTVAYNAWLSAGAKPIDHEDDGVTLAFPSGDKRKFKSEVTKPPLKGGFHIPNEENDMSKAAQTGKARFEEAAAIEIARGQANKFRDTVHKYMADGDSGTDAMKKAQREDPEGFEAFQNWDDAWDTADDIENDAKAEKAHDAAVTKATSLHAKMEKAVADVIEREGCTPTKAMETVRKEQPELHYEYYNSI